MPQPRRNKALATSVSIALCGALLSIPAVGYAEANETPSNPSAVTVLNEPDTTNQAEQLMALIDQPFADSLGYQYRTELDSPAKITQVRNQLSQALDTYNPDLKSVYFSRANTLLRLFSTITNQRDTLASTVLTVPGHGDEEKLRIKLDQFFRFDSRVLTGLSVSPTVESTFDYNGKAGENAAVLYVFVEGASQGVELSYRPVGVSENNNYQSLTYQSIPLKQGFNRVCIDMSDRTKPVALYLRNNSETQAQARIMATDSYRSTGQETKPYAPASANTAILGSQLQTYPTYIDSAENRTHFWQFVQDLREYAASAGQSQQAGDMTDIRLTRQDLSLSATDAANIAFSDVTAENAQKFIQDVSEINTNRLNLYDKFDGRESNVTDANVVNPLTVVLAGTKNVTDPSTMYAYTNYYHLPSRDVAHVLKGEPEAVYGWANAHEYGHVVDNNTLVQPEITNNLYSLISSLELLKMHQQSQTNVKELDISQDFHPNIAEARNKIDAMLLNHMQGGEQSEGTYDQGDWFLKTLTMYEIMAYTNTLSYDTYDYVAHPGFTSEQAQEVKTYGAYGAALRLLRSGESRAARMVGKNDPTAKVNKLIALLAQATGYNVCPYFTARGFSAIQQNVQRYCGSFADLPDGAVMYSLEAQAKQALHSVKPEAYPTFTNETTATAARDDSGTMTVTLSNPVWQASVDYMDVYRGDTRIGFSRTLSFTPPADNTSANNAPAPAALRRVARSLDATNASDNSNATYRFVVHDYAGNTISTTLSDEEKPEDPKETEQPEDPKDTEDPKGTEDPKDNEESKDTENPKDNEDPKGTEDPKDADDPKETEDPKDTDDKDSGTNPDKDPSKPTDNTETPSNPDGNTGTNTGNSGNTGTLGSSDTSDDSKASEKPAEPDNTKHATLAKTGSTAPLLLLTVSLIGAFGSFIARRKRAQK